ncbi:PA14 domain-containing protein [Sulfitobacter guttiformis]|uniref:PA14 domain-containing protein n=1 Tax=Sulfitobacter guttiformis TaxID=74349 RepID=A0A420DHU5_9RHOB|nr:hypothetical protein [Sulfitobacter guttiformis]KIN72458.1 hypothetical protein Z949_1633 [Sulfitobacter guttiformis KCTC 32187]RKE93790.1 hypothetical protein C8N30_2886 [Sulfitobacter guttiformis]
MNLLVSTAAAATLSAALCTSALAAPLMLTPADPQPQGLSQGLSVSYAKGAGGRSLGEAKSKLARMEAGDPLQGLSYVDTNEGDHVLTSDQSEKLAAAISGYILFDAAGTYQLNFFSNDGLEATIGGQVVALADDVRSCDPTGETEVEVPSAGWYALEATYFQRKGSACLMMDWDVGGAMAPVPDTAFGFVN